MKKKVIRIMVLFLGVMLLTGVCIESKAEVSQEADNSVKEWRYIYFGNYPQSEVTDEATIADIDAAIDKAFDEDNVSYGDKGIDITVDGVQYRKLVGRYFRWEPIKWRVLKDDGETLFVMACRGLDAGQYQPSGITYEAVTWETCSLRKWMNWQFPANAFTDDEWNAVVAQTVKNDPNPVYGMTGGNDTQDKVFALSYQEVTDPELGFRKEDNVITTSRMIIPSEYACAARVSAYEQNMLDIGDNKVAYWWLRSPGQYNYQAVEVNLDGVIDSSGDFPSAEYAVVPAMHIAASSEWITEADGQGEIKQMKKAPIPVSSVPSGSEVACNSKIYLSCPAENTTIYYTVEGSKPTKYSTKYSGEVRIGDRSMTIKAIAIGGGYEESDVAVFEYTVAPENIPTIPPGGGIGGSGTGDENASAGTSGSGDKNTTTGTSGSENNGGKNGDSGQSSGNNGSDNDKASSEKKDLSVGKKFTDTASCGVYMVTSLKKGSSTVKYVKPANSKISKVVIPSTIKRAGTTYQVTEVGAKAFYNCKKLKTVTIGKNVTTIGSNAFKECKNLKNIIIKSKKLKTLGKATFAGVSSKATIKVPSSKYKAYKKLFKKKGLKKSVKIKK